MANVFISYARRDRERVLALASAIEGEGLSVWWDPNLVPGKRFRDIIAAELEAADSVVVVWTAASIQSDYVQDEAEEARIRGVLVPITLEPVKPPAGFRQVQAADLSQWTGSAQHPEFRMLLTAVRTLVAAAEAEGRASPPAPDRRAPDGPAPRAADAGAPLAAAAPPAAAPSPAAAAQAGPHPDLMFLPRAFDAFARPAVWLTIAGLVAASGLGVGFGLSGVAAAMVIWAGATAQAALNGGLGPNRKMMAMVTAVGVGLVIGVSAHDLHGAVSAILVASIVFAGVSMIGLSSRGGTRRGSPRDAAVHADYRAYGEEIRREVMETLRHRRRRRPGRPRPEQEG